MLLKFIAFPFYPVGMTIFLGVAAIVTLLYSRRYAGVLFTLSMSNLLIFSSAPVSNFLTRNLEQKFYGEKTISDSCSAIVVLGGGGIAWHYPRIYPEVGEAGDRILHAARLYHQNVCRRIITTGRDPEQKDFFRTEAEQNARLLIEMGVDSNDIIIEPKARNTHEHGPFVGAILDSLHLERKIVLVTSATHMHRAIAVFRKEGFKVIPAATDFNSEINMSLGSFATMPSAYSLMRSTVALHEYFGVLGYRLLGWI